MNKKLNDEFNDVLNTLFYEINKISFEYEDNLEEIYPLLDRLLTLRKDIENYIEQLKESN